MLIKDLDLRWLRVKIFWWEKGADSAGRFKEKAGLTANNYTQLMNQSIKNLFVEQPWLPRVCICIFLLQIQYLVSHKYKPEFRQIGPS